MSVAATRYQCAHYVHVGAGTGEDALFELLHNPQFDVFKRHAFHQLFSGLV